MPLTLLPAAGRTPKPWKNGGGVTTDVWVWPEGAGLDTFLARVSIAEVAADGPFSLFPGVDRSTAILDGAGFDLTFANGAAHRLNAAAEPLQYRGDDDAFSRLIAGPTTDLNVMSRRGAMRRWMERLRIDGETTLEPAPLTILLIAEGTLEVASAKESLAAGPRDACFAQGERRLALRGRALAYVCAFEPV